MSTIRLFFCNSNCPFYRSENTVNNWYKGYCGYTDSTLEWVDFTLPVKRDKLFTGLFPDSCPLSNESIVIEKGINTNDTNA